VYFTGETDDGKVVEEQGEPQNSQDVEDAGERYEMDEEIVERRFREGQVLRLVLNDQRIDIRVTEVGEGITLTTPSGVETAELGQELLLDLTQDKQKDLRILVQDIDSQGGTAVLRFDRGLGRTAETSSDEESNGEGGAEGTDRVELGTAAVESRSQKPVTILSADQPEPFRLDVNFRGYSLVRYLKDGEIREERFFNRDDGFRLNVDREVMLWISNAGSFQAKIGGEEVDFGDPGEVSTKLLRWEPDGESDRYNLRMLPVY